MLVQVVGEVVGVGHRNALINFFSTCVRQVADSQDE